MRNRLALLLASVLLVSACGGDSSPTASSSTSVNLAGNWIGTVTSAGRVAQVGVGTFHGTLAQNGLSLNGSWNVVYSNVANNNSGALTGVITGNSVTLTLTSGVPTACPFNATGTLSGSSSMTGTYSTFNCTVADGGQFSMQKQ